MGRPKKDNNEPQVVIDEPAEKVIDGVFDKLVIVKPEKEEKEEPKEQVPNIGTPEWTPYVLSKLQPDEMWNGCPTYEGLRRITYELLGDIVDIDIDLKQAPNYQNANHSCAIARLTIEHPYDFEWLGRIAGKTIRYSHVGDSFHGNGNNDPFAFRFSSATCWTRVKASLLRDAFRLKYVYAKEELSDIPEDDSGVSGLVNSNQIDGLDMMCSRINVDAAKFMRGVWKKVREKDDHSDLNKCPFNVAAQSFGLLNQLQQNPKNIQPELIGYNKVWKDCFKCLK